MFEIIWTKEKTRRDISSIQKINHFCHFRICKYIERPSQYIQYALALKGWGRISQIFNTDYPLVKIEGINLKFKIFENFQSIKYYKYSEHLIPKISQ